MKMNEDGTERRKCDLLWVSHWTLDGKIGDRQAIGIPVGGRRRPATSDGAEAAIAIRLLFINPKALAWFIVQSIPGLARGRCVCDCIA